MSYKIIFCIETFNVGGGATIALMSLIKNNPEIKETVLESVTKTLNISSDKVCITKLKEK